MILPPLACGSCVTEAWALAFPPTFAWCAISLCWFLGLAVFARWNDVSVAGVPSLGRSALLVAAGVIAGAAVMGPFTVLPFGLAAAVATVRGVRPPGVLSPGGRVAGYVIAALAVGSLAISAVGTIAAERDAPATAHRVIRRQTDAAAWRAEFAKLRGAEPASLPIYWEILRRMPLPDVQEETLRRIEALVDPATEVPRLLDEYERLLRERNLREAEGVETALRRLSGCSPEPDSDAAVWREAWAAKKRAR